MKKNYTCFLLAFAFAAISSYGQRAPKIDLSMWKLSIPEGSQTTYAGQDLANYSSNIEIQRFMFNDNSERALVFYAYPSVKSKNSYTRTELKEQNSFGTEIGWTFREGAKLKTVIRMGTISKNDDKYPRVILVQMGSRLKDDQAEKVNANDNNLPPFLKIYWDNGKIKLRSKKAASLSITGSELYKENSWVDDDGFAFKEKVDFDKFTLEINVMADRTVVTLNNGETKVYSGEDYRKWSQFENFFRTGCYLQSREAGAFANAKYFTLEVAH